jgi:Rrf2 family protein
MRLQKATRFGLYAVLELALDPARQLSAAEIAGKYGISSNHLAKVLRELGRAGLVDSVRGAGGGYRFTGNARRVTLLDVIELFEDMQPTSAASGELGEATEVGAALHGVLVEIDEIARATLASVTIETLIKLMKRGQRREDKEAPPARKAGAGGR